MNSCDVGKRELANVLRRELPGIRLEVTCSASLAGTATEDPGAMDWLGEATLSVWPEGNHPAAAWQEDIGMALSTADAGDGGRKLQVLRANGLVVDLWSAADVFSALDARSQDYAEFLPMFGQRGAFGQVELAEELEDILEPGGGRVVIVDRVQIAPAWRGLGGAGRFLIARLLRWVAADAKVVALSPFPTELNEKELEDPAVFDQALAQVRHVWRSLAFEPFSEQIWIMDPRMKAHEDAVAKLAKRLGLAQHRR